MYRTDLTRLRPHLSSARGGSRQSEEGPYIMHGHAPSGCQFFSTRVGDNFFLKGEQLGQQELFKRATYSTLF